MVVVDVKNIDGIKFMSPIWQSRVDVNGWDETLFKCHCNRRLEHVQAAATFQFYCGRGVRIGQESLVQPGQLYGTAHGLRQTDVIVHLQGFVKGVATVLSDWLLEQLSDIEPHGGKNHPSRLTGVLSVYSGCDFGVNRGFLPPMVHQ